MVRKLEKRELEKTQKTRDVKEEMKSIILNCGHDIAARVLRFAKSNGHYDVIEFARANAKDPETRKAAERYVNSFVNRMRRDITKMKGQTEQMSRELGSR